MSDTFQSIDSTSNMVKEVTPITTSSGSAQANKIAMTSATGQFDASLIPGAGAVSLVAGEAITGPAVTYVDSTGKVRNADNTSMSKVAQGFCLSTIANAASGTYNAGQGEITGYTGKTPGSAGFLGTAGAIVATPPAAGSGNVYQLLGFWLSATTFQFQPQQPIQR